MDEDGNVQGELKATGIVPQFYKKLASKGVELPVEVFEHSWTRTG
jgi:hypothetical protein